MRGIARQKTAAASTHRPAVAARRHRSAETATRGGVNACAFAWLVAVAAAAAAAVAAVNDRMSFAQKDIRD